jgi:hypothetical protein
MEKELTNEELALWCEDMGKVFVEVAAKHSGDVRALPVRNAFSIIAERLRNPPDSSRVRETAKDLPEGDGNVLGFHVRYKDWTGVHISNVRHSPAEWTHWLPMPPAPKEASDGK